MARTVPYGGMHSKSKQITWGGYDISTFALWCLRLKKRSMKQQHSPLYIFFKSLNQNMNWKQNWMVSNSSSHQFQSSERYLRLTLSIFRTSASEFIPNEPKADWWMFHARFIQCLATVLCNHYVLMIIPFFIFSCLHFEVGCLNKEQVQLF